MNAFLRKGFDEYMRQTDLKKNFARNNERVYRLFENWNLAESHDAGAKAHGNEEVFMLLVAPLVEVAWADGRVTSRESDSILQTAEAYGLTEHQDLYCALMETMISRPSPKMSARNWHRLHQLLIRMPRRRLEILNDSLLGQARYVAEQSSNSLIGFLRGDGICRDEEAILQKIAEELKKAELVRDEEAVFFAGWMEEDEKEKLLPLVPLVKVAWAEGRVTKREKQIILDAAARFGVEPDSPSYSRLLDWLELHPTDDFYNESLEHLSRCWEKLDAGERALKSLDVLSDCALIAEASGGNGRYPAGGVRVCDEELKAIRRIAQKLNRRQTDIALS